MGHLTCNAPKNLPYAVALVRNSLERHTVKAVQTVELISVRFTTFWLDRAQMWMCLSCVGA